LEKFFLKNFAPIWAIAARLPDVHGAEKRGADVVY